MDNNSTGIYIKAKDKYKNLRQSGFSLILIGIIGLILVAINYYGFLPIKIDTEHMVIFTVTMGSLFIVMFLGGISSLKSAKKLKDTIKDEEDLTESILTWATENISVEEIARRCENGEYDDNFGSADDDFSDYPEEVKCMARINIIEKMLRENFELENEAYITSLTDEIYPKFFE